MSVPEPFSAEAFHPVSIVRDHTLHLGTESIAFRSVCEDTVFYTPEGTPEASIFTISYERTDVTGPRPVAFVWNGGPGSATSTLHLECLGPYGISQDEEGRSTYGLTENPLCILDVCDLVFVDPVGVGLSRLLDPNKAGKYYSVDGDARSVAFTIVEYLRRRGRWDSPITLIGESYGTVRACRVLAELGRSPYSESRMVLGIPVSNVVLIGLATSKDRSDIDETLALMPAMAATHWYHTHDEDMTSKDFHAFVEDAWTFAGSDLLSAQFEGNTLSPQKAHGLSERLETFTGLSARYWESHSLHLGSVRDFMSGAVPGFTVDLYDSRNKTPADQPYNEIGSSNVPIRVMNGLLLPQLGFSEDRLYYTGNINVNAQFTYDTEPFDPPFMRTHIDCLRDSMQANPQMQVLFASGLFDLCTYAGNTRYVISHAGLPMDRVLHMQYPGGHGVYSTQEGKAAFMSDLRRMLQHS
ncbi:MAG: hypothetical protein IJ708_05350 [Clostridia bacterium]|nr:hypothetical protein [Clostridia bacterium]